MINIISSVLCYIIFLIFLFDLPIIQATKGVKTVPLRQIIQRTRLRNAIHAQRRKLIDQKNSTMIDNSPEDCPHCRFEKCKEDEEDEGDEENFANDPNLFCYVKQIRNSRKTRKEPLERCATGKQLSKLVNQDISQLINTWEGCQILQNTKICWCRIEIEELEEDAAPEESDDRPQHRSRLNMIQQRNHRLHVTESPSAAKSSAHIQIFTPFLLFAFIQIRLFMPNL